MSRPLLLAALALAASAAQPAGARIDATVPSATYRTIQEAIDAAAAEIDGGTITVRAGTYSDPLTLRPRVTLRGEETARTILTGGITAQGGGSLQRFTVIGNAASFSSAPNLDIRNNVFHGFSGAALEVRNAADATIANNTFFGNGTSLTLANSTGTARANVFAQNAVAVDWDNQGISFPHNFFDRRAQDVTEETATDRDPFFVAPEAGDFHLRAGSPCIGAAVDSDGSETDQGAYGGSGADPRPFPVVGLTAEVDATGTRAVLAWQPNLAYDVSGYRVHYGADATHGGTGADQGPSPVTVGLVTALELTGLAVAAAPPAAVEGLEAFPRNRGVLLRWSPAPGATGYRVLWSLADGALENAAEVGNTTTHTVTGLANDTAYRFAVRSLGGTTHHFAVAALAGAREGARTADLPVPVTQLEGELSAEVIQTPEESLGFPDLSEHGGCFLRATAGPSARGNALLSGVWVLGVLGAAAAWRRLGVISAVLALALLLPQAARAEAPRWSVSVKGGVLFPGEGDWGSHYDSDLVADWRVGVGLRLSPRFELGVEGGYREAEGKVDTSGRGAPLGRTLEQTLTVVPAQVYLLYDLRWAEHQLVVPYLGGGYSRYYYRHEVDEGADVRGRQHGYHARGGIKVLLNPMDPSAAHRARAGFGVTRTYACIEGQYAQVDDFGSADADLGGWSALAGFALHF